VKSSRPHQRQRAASWRQIRQLAASTSAFGGSTCTGNLPPAPAAPRSDLFFAFRAGGISSSTRLVHRRKMAVTCQTSLTNSLCVLHSHGDYTWQLNAKHTKTASSKNLVSWSANQLSRTHAFLWSLSWGTLQPTLILTSSSQHIPISPSRTPQSLLVPRPLVLGHVDLDNALL
jgi:hypothetical protein